MPERGGRGDRMKILCIYESNTGLGKCAGPIEKVKVVNKRTQEWRGLEGLKARLATSGETPGVCGAHEERAEVNGYIREEQPEIPPGKS